MHVVSVSPELVFQALTDLTRVRVIRLLASTDEEACLCEFVDSLQEPEYKLSRHLKVLKSIGLLTAQRDGRWVYHRLVKDAPFLKALFSAVEAIPDTDGVFKRDLANFRRRLAMREEGRCRTGIRTSKLADRGNARQRKSN